MSFRPVKYYQKRKPVNMLFDRRWHPPKKKNRRIWFQSRILSQSTRICLLHAVLNWIHSDRAFSGRRFATAVHFDAERHVGAVTDCYIRTHLKIRLFTRSPPLPLNPLQCPRSDCIISDTIRSIYSLTYTAARVDCAAKDLCSKSVTVRCSRSWSSSHDRQPVNWLDQDAGRSS